MNQQFINIAGGYRLMREEIYLEDSKIFLLEQGVQGSQTFLPVPTDGYPSEQPALLRDRSGNVHLFWGDRRLDPNFEEFTIARRQILGFSTNVIYSMYDGIGFTPPVSIYEGHLRKLMGGIGDIYLPVRVTEDSLGNLHTIFTADTTYAVIGLEGEDATGFTPRAIHLVRSPDGEWSEPHYLRGGSSMEPDIAVLPDNRLAAAYLGEAYLGQPGLHNVQIVISDDGGNSWNEPHTVFFSGGQWGRMLRLKAGPDGSLHILWGRQTGSLPLPSELWHSYSVDAGATWSEPDRFFVLEQDADIENFIDSFDFVIDPHDGRVHGAAVEFMTVLEPDGLLYYFMWDPSENQWKITDPLLSEELRGGVGMTIDETTDKLYLFWEEYAKNAIYYSVKELREQVTPPGIAVAGPLQLHANYPNPFNTSTQIVFTLEERAEVELSVFDMSGRHLLHRDLGQRSEGLHTEEVSLEGYASGAYIYEITLNGTWRQQSTMMLIR